MCKRQTQRDETLSPEAQSERCSKAKSARGKHRTEATEVTERESGMVETQTTITAVPRTLNADTPIRPSPTRSPRLPQALTPTARLTLFIVFCATSRAREAPSAKTWSTWPGSVSSSARRRLFGAKLSQIISNSLFLNSP